MATDNDVRLDPATLRWVADGLDEQADREAYWANGHDHECDIAHGHRLRGELLSDLAARLRTQAIRRADSAIPGSPP